MIVGPAPQVHQGRAGWLFRGVSKRPHSRSLMGVRERSVSDGRERREVTTLGVGTPALMQGKDACFLATVEASGRQSLLG